MKKITLFFILLNCIITHSQNSELTDKESIRNVLHLQEKAWSNNNLEGFMKGYWKNDSLKFYGSNGLTYGWKKTLENYKKGYPTKEHTGTLKFKINDISKIEKNSYFVMAEYHLTRKTGNVSGVFMIIFRKINGQWKIVADTSC